MNSIFTLLIRSEMGYAQELYNFEDLLNYVWQSKATSAGDVLYAGIRIDEIASVLFAALMINDAGHAGLRLLFPLIPGGVSRAVLDTRDGKGLYYDCRNNKNVVGGPDLILETPEEVSHYKDCVWSDTEPKEPTDVD